MERSSDVSGGLLQNRSKRAASSSCWRADAEIIGKKRVQGVRFNDAARSAPTGRDGGRIRPNIDLAKATAFTANAGCRQRTLQTFDPAFTPSARRAARGQTYVSVAPLFGRRKSARTIWPRWASSLRGIAHLDQAQGDGRGRLSAGDFAGGNGAEAIVLQGPHARIYKKLGREENRIKARS